MKQCFLRAGSRQIFLFTKTRHRHYFYKLGLKIGFKNVLWDAICQRLRTTIVFRLMFRGLQNSISLSWLFKYGGLCLYSYWQTQI